MEMLRDRPVRIPLPSVIVVAIGDTVPEVMRSAAALRANGLRTGTDTSGRKLKKTLASAASKGIRYVLLVGEDEAALGKVRVKDMKMKTEFVITVQEVVERLTVNGI